jgi:pimeloyl-ACP methyl ester carboxylesterase
MDLFFQDRGTGEPLVLLHGFTGSSNDWVHAFDLDALAARYRLIMPDARNHGRTPKGTLTYRQNALDVLAILDRLGIESTFAVGASLGAKTLLHLATIAPSRVRRMVLASATPRIPEDKLAIVRSAGAPTDMSFQREELATITAPTLVVHGDRDELYPVELAVELFRSIPTASLYVVPGGTHGVAFERGTRFEEHVLAFFDQ